jgi:hypothetical protein
MLHYYKIKLEFSSYSIQKIENFKDLSPEIGDRTRFNRIKRNIYIV